jgi:hypothetical protein
MIGYALFSHDPFIDCLGPNIELFSGGDIIYIQIG